MKPAKLPKKSMKPGHKKMPGFPLKPVSTASTGSAAAQLRTVTDNSLLHLGKFRDKINITEDTASPNSNFKIRCKLRGSDVLVVDEV